MIVRSLRTVVGLAVVGTSLLWSQVTAQAQTFNSFQVTNQTASNGGDFPVTDSVIFNSLVLNVLFNDTSSQNVDLFIPGDTTVQTSLDTNTFNLESALFNAAQHGGLLKATLTGSFDITSWNVAPTPFGATTPVTVAGNFVTVLDNPANPQVVNINGIDRLNNRYAAGTLASSSTPEPSAVALLMALGTSVVPFSLRRRARLQHGGAEPDLCAVWSGAFRRTAKIHRRLLLGRPAQRSQSHPCRNLRAGRHEPAWQHPDPRRQVPDRQQ